MSDYAPAEIDIRVDAATLPEACSAVGGGARPVCLLLGARDHLELGIDPDLLQFGVYDLSDVDGVPPDGT